MFVLSSGGRELRTFWSKVVWCQRIQLKVKNNINMLPGMRARICLNQHILRLKTELELFKLLTFWEGAALKLYLLELLSFYRLTGTTGLYQLLSCGTITWDFLTCTCPSLMPLPKPLLVLGASVHCCTVDLLRSTIQYNLAVLRHLGNFSVYAMTAICGHSSGLCDHYS